MQADHVPLRSRRPPIENGKRAPGKTTEIRRPLEIPRKKYTEATEQQQSQKPSCEFQSRIPVRARTAERVSYLWVQETSCMLLSPCREIGVGVRYEVYLKINSGVGARSRFVALVGTRAKTKKPLQQSTA